jgi:hypothetical protein
MLTTRDLPVPAIRILLKKLALKSQCHATLVYGKIGSTRKFMVAEMQIRFLEKTHGKLQKLKI